MTRTTYNQLFVYSAGGMLLATAITRLAVASSSALVLTLLDPVLGISLHWAVMIVGGLELAVAIVCLSGKKRNLALYLLAWLTVNYFAYLGGLFWLGCHPQASWAGSLTDPFHLSRGVIGFISGLAPFYFLTGICIAAGWPWLEKKKSRAVHSLKMACPGCGGRIRFASENIGQSTPCPHCRKTITLRLPRNLKMACFFCKEHIEFPSHAIGEKMPCPHCNQDITLKEPA